MRKFVGVIVLIVVVVGLWSAGWLFVAGEAKRQVEALATNDGETNPKLTCGTLDVGGFPFRFDMTCADATLLTGDETITVKGLKASVLAYNPTHVIFSATAPYSMANAFTGSQSRFDFSALEGSARVTSGDLFKGLTGEGWRIARISFLVDGLAWYDTILDEKLQLSADHFELQVTDVPDQHDSTTGRAALAAYLTIKALSVPAFNITKAETSLAAELSGLPDDLRLFGDADPLRRWQQADGVLKIVDFTGSQAAPDENFDLSGEASLTPSGLLDARLDYTTKGVLERFAGAMGPLELAALRGKPEADGKFSNSLAMTDGKLQLLTFTLMDVPPLF